VTASIEIATEPTDELVSALGALLPQLSSATPPDATQLAEVLAAPGTVQFVARLDGRIVGALTLVTFRIPTGLKAWIEDVVVDDAARGHGIGEALNRAALEEATRRGLQSVTLTSRPAREGANRLYQRLGFVQRTTNVYRYTLGSGPVD
jgi:ribosomal protein S18 acetylase RimI-like enzyme